MKTVIYGQDRRVREFVGERTDEDSFGENAVTIGLEQDGELIGGVVFNMYTGAAICMSVAGVPGKRWITREFIQRAFAYPFVQLNCNRATALVRVDNLVSQRFVEQLGFKREGLLRKASTDGTDMILYGILKEECHWLGAKNGTLAHT